MKRTRAARSKTVVNIIGGTIGAVAVGDGAVSTGNVSKSEIPVTHSQNPTRGTPNSNAGPFDVPIDFAILTAIPVERKAVCAAFGLGNEDRIKKGGRWYWRGRLPLDNGSAYEIVIAQPADMGQIEAASLAKDVLRDWNPAGALLVGIAATTDPKKVKLSDVVVGKSIWYYEHAKVTPEGKKSQPEMMPADAHLLQHLAGLADWDCQITAPRPDGTDAKPRLHQGVIASGEKVIADEAVRDDIASGHRKIIALAMEEYGFTRAMSQHRVHHLVIRGICDEASSAKDDGWHEYAAAAAASFAKHFLLDRPLEPRGEPDPASNDSRNKNAESPSTGSLSSVRDRLIDLVARVQWDRHDLMQAYTSCVVGDLRNEFDRQRGTELAPRMVRKLFNMVRQDDGTIPWLYFLLYLVAIASSSNADNALNQLTGQLSDLFAEAAQAAGFSAVTVDAWKLRVETQRDRLKNFELHIVVIVEPRMDRPTFSVRAYRVIVPFGSTTWSEHDGQPLPIPGGDDLEVRSEAELAMFIKEFFVEMDDEFASAKDTTIEVFVPVSLLGCNLDQWPVQQIFDDILIGSEYKVVVRCWERVYKRGSGAAMSKWKAQWDRLVRRLPGSTWRCGSEHLHGVQLRFPPEHPACVVMGSVPPAVDTVKSMIVGGTAIAVWPRRLVQGSSELDAFLSNRLSEDQLDSWRDEIRTFRHAAAKHEIPHEHAGSHLTLLWDDPNKLPPRRKSLEPPAKMVR